MPIAAGKSRTKLLGDCILKSTRNRRALAQEPGGGPDEITFETRTMNS